MTFSDLNDPRNSGKRVIVSMFEGSDHFRFFIGMGYPGFNSPANNRSGYATPEAALKASLRYERKGIASRDSEWNTLVRKFETMVEREREY